MIGSSIPQKNTLETIDSRENNTSDELMPVNTEIIYRFFYIGTISNLVRTDTIVEFDSINVLRISHVYSVDGSYWDVGISHHENTHHLHDGYEFSGLISSSFLLGVFVK